MGARVLPFDRHPGDDRPGDRDEMTNPWGVRGDVDLHDLQGPTPPDPELIHPWVPMPAPPSHRACGYALAAHRDGRCPDENEARAAWGDR